MFITLLASLALTSAAERSAVVLVTDCGASIDDQFALIHLALSPEIDLRGIITTLSPNLGENSAEVSAKAAREVLGWLERKPSPPVLAGSSRPIAETRGEAPGRAAEFLISESRRSPAGRKLSVLVIGTMTDVAGALRVDPGLADRIEIVAMGFEDWEKGGDVWNVRHDVEAWRLVMRSDVPIVVGDDSTTRRRLRLSLPEARSRLDDRGGASKSLLSAYSRWLDLHADEARALSGRADAFPIWDEVVSAHILGMTRSETRPRPALKADATFDHSRPRGTIRWITEVDADRLWEDLSKKLATRR